MLQVVNTLVHYHFLKKQVKPENRSVANHLPFCNHSASYDNFRNLTRENKKILLELNESLLIMRDKPSLNRNIRHHCTCLAGPCYKTFVRVLFALIVAMLFLLNGLFYYLAMCNCVSTTVRLNGTVQFTFFLVMRLNSTIDTGCDSLIVITVT